MDSETIARAKARLAESLANLANAERELTFSQRKADTPGENRQLWIDAVAYWEASISSWKNAVEFDETYITTLEQLA